MNLLSGGIAASLTLFAPRNDKEGVSFWGQRAKQPHCPFGHSEAKG